MGYVNMFESKSDNELITLYEQFLDGVAKHGFSYDNDLGRIKLEYEKLMEPVQCLCSRLK